ncbi:putative retrotransposon protein [Tanacetum coccineum]
MGTCFSKKNTKTPQILELNLKSDQQPPKNEISKKEVFVIKHRISHETDNNPCSSTKEDSDEILLQCGRLNRSNSTGAQNPRKRRCSRSKRSFDFDLNTRLKNTDFDDEVKGSSPSSSRRSSRERDLTRRRSNSRDRERRISISPSRRSQSPFRTATVNVGASGNRPVKMVSVPATDKSSNSGEQMVVGAVKRIHVKRNVSPAKRNLRIFTDEQGQGLKERQLDERNMREIDSLYYGRKSLAEIDNNSARSAQSGNTKMGRIRKLSRDLDMNQETRFDPSPPSYASLLLEDIHNFHQKNTNSSAATTQPSFALPECVSKACSIMEAVADLNSNTSSLLSDDRWKNLKKMERTVTKDRVTESGTVVNDVAVDEQDSREPNSATRQQEVKGLGGFKRDFMDYPRKGIGRGRKSTCTTVALT